MSCAFGGGIAVLDTRSNQYFTLDEVGTTIWNLMEAPVDMGEIVDAVTSEYDVAEDVCREDIVTFLEAIDQHGLVNKIP